MENQKEQFAEIAKAFEAKCGSNTDLLTAVHEAEAFFAENFDCYQQDSLAGTMNNMWYCVKGNDAGGKSLLHDCFGAMQQVAKGATIKA